MEALVVCLQDQLVYLLGRQSPLLSALVVAVVEAAEIMAQTGQIRFLGLSLQQAAEAALMAAITRG